MHILGGCIYCESLFILIKNTLFNCLTGFMNFSFGNVLFPGEFPQIICGDLYSVSHVKTCYCFSKICIYAQISCSRHSKFVKIIPILMHRIASAVFVYISFPTSTRMIWLDTCPVNSGQK